jgi:hypothetical protein
LIFVPGCANTSKAGWLDEFLGGYISEEEAIKNARLYCYWGEELQEPYNIWAVRCTLRDAYQKIDQGADNYHNPQMTVWLVTMAGSWELSGPPPPEGSTPAPPLIFNRCTIILDARNGMPIHEGGRKPEEAP